MKGERTTVRLGDVTRMLSGATPFKGNAAYWNGPIPWVSAKDMKRLYLYDAEDHITQEGLDNGSKLAPVGSTLILTRGMTLLNDVPICRVMKPLAFNQDVKALEPSARLDSQYLTYLLLALKPELLNTVEQAGHGTGKLPSELIKGLEVSLPDLDEQRQIASILGALDDKIELNRRMNGTLEALAQAVFKEWFVEKAEGEREENSLGALFSISKASVNPGSSPEEVFDHYSIPAFDEGRVPKQETGDSIKSNKFTVPVGCVLISKLNPRFPRVWLPYLDGKRQAISSTEFIVCQPKSKELRAFIYGLFTSQAFTSEYTNMATGSTGSHQRVRPESMLNMTTAMADRSRIKEYAALVLPMLDKMNANISESRTLTALRDALLPKLMRGEVRVTALHKESQ